MASFEKYYLKKTKKDFNDKGVPMMTTELWKNNKKIGELKQEQTISLWESSFLTKEDLIYLGKKMKRSFPQFFNFNYSKDKKRDTIEWEDFLIALHDLDELEKFYKKNKQFSNQVAYYYVNKNEIFRGVVKKIDKTDLFDFLKLQRKEKHKEVFKEDHILLIDEFELS